MYGKSAKGLPPLNRSKLSKKHKIMMMRLKKYMNIIVGVIIGNPN